MVFRPVFVILNISDCQSPFQTSITVSGRTCGGEEWGRRKVAQNRRSGWEKHGNQREEEGE